MPSNDTNIRDYLAGLDLEVVDVPTPRGGCDPEPPRLRSIAALQAKLRSQDRGKRPDVRPRPATANDLVLVRVRSRKDSSREFTVIYSRSHGAIVGEQN